ncbi:hypothetical protein [Streptomyces similanensis]|uniref:MarR family transcriptional regulator n=1 Tax=Streptomyces similanensis TaxID=1274988 RepID=A0ABP9L838_9ACTN
MRRRVVTVVLPNPEPEPAYDLYQEVRADAERRSRGPLDPQKLKEMHEVAGRRGRDWCTAVLGHAFPGVDRSSTADGWMLILADEMRLDPPLPQRIVAQRALRQEAEELRAKQEREQREREESHWEKALAAAGVEMTVRENTRHTGVGGRLRHAVPKEDLVSGRSRRHPAERGLCETPGRTDPLHLSEPVDAPANCHRCLGYVGKVRALDAPAPPTPAERKTLQLVKAGVVFTFRPARGGPTIRDTSQRSKAAWGHLGRKVDAAVVKLEKKGWAAKDADHSRTQAGHLGDRWRLTDAGNAALED